GGDPRPHRPRPRGRRGRPRPAGAEGSAGAGSAPRPRSRAGGAGAADLFTALRPGLEAAAAALMTDPQAAAMPDPRFPHETDTPAEGSPLAVDADWRSVDRGLRLVRAGLVLFMV